VSALSIDDDANGLVALCSEGSKAIYYAEFELSKHQPCGEYMVELHAVSSGAEDVLINYIDVLCVFYLELDFDSVNWGTIYPGVSKVVPGDTIFPSSMPTVKNTGNSGMGVAIEYEPMVQVNPDGTPVPGGKIIDEFDACFGTSYTSLFCVDPITSADEIVPLYPDGTTDTTNILCSNDTGKIDFSIHPPATLPSGAYEGDVTIWGQDVPICPTNMGHVDPDWNP
jgi:hypothetical protein